MIQCRVPNFTDYNERETVLLILMGLVEHPTYGTSATKLFSVDLIITTIPGVKEHLELHEMTLYDLPKTRFSMECPNKPK